MDLLGDFHMSPTFFSHVRIILNIMQSITQIVRLRCHGIDPLGLQGFIVLRAWFPHAT